MALVDSIVAYWKLNELSGIRYDAAGGNDLADTNTVTRNPGPGGPFAFAGQFTRANQEYLSIGDNAALSMGNIDFSVCGWFMLDSKPVAYPNLMGKRDGAQDEWAIFYANGGGEDRIRVGVWDTGAGTETDFTAATLGSPSTGVWYFLVWWHDSVANTVNIQVNDGAVDSTAYAAGLSDTTGTFRIGSSSDPATQAWDGRICGVGLWKRVLTAAERTQLYGLGSLSIHPFLVGGHRTASARVVAAPARITRAERFVHKLRSRT